MNELPKNTNKIFREYRRGLRISQAEMANKVGIGFSTYVNFELYGAIGRGKVFDRIKDYLENIIYKSNGGINEKIN